MSDRVPVNVLTGFLGSGKTTLLQRLLRSPQMGRTAVLINEFGEVGLDHLLVERVEETVVLLASGCICCTIRGDLNGALRGLLGRRDRSEIPAFDRVVIETTGLADPGPILYTLLNEPVLQHHFQLGNVIATVDAVMRAAFSRNPRASSRSPRPTACW
jgi:G3E family GTPase